MRNADSRTFTAGIRALQTGNSEVDDRSYIYIVDADNIGMYTPRLSGAARRLEKLS